MLILFYIPYALLHVSIHLHRLQAVLTLNIAKVTKLLKLYFSKISIAQLKPDGTR